MLNYAVKNELIKLHICTNRLTPYAVAFDLLEYFADDCLTKKVHNFFTECFEKRSHYKNEIDLWVDMESMGDVTVLMAKQLASIFSKYIKHEIKITIEVGVPMTRDNQCFIEFLADFSENIQITLINTENKEHCHHQGSHFLRELGLSHGDCKNDIEKILYLAWRCAELGAEEVGFRILEQGIVEGNEFSSTLCLVQLQFMRVAAQHYQAAANEARRVPEHHIAMMQSFYLATAWGSVLSRQLDKAAQFFAKAGVAMQSVPDDADLNALYRMNIFALLQHLNGETQNAFLIEKRIQAAINLSPEPRPQIAYINSINLARLYRYTNDYNEAINHYDLAFSTMGNIKSETDFVYMNACYGMFYEKKGNDNIALLYWLKSAMHWLIMETPSALGWRAIRAIADPSFKPRSDLDVNYISRAFINKLIKLQPYLNYSVVLSAQFIAANQDMDFSDAKACGMNGISFIIQQSNNIDQPNVDEDKNKLAKIVAVILNTLFNIPSKPFNTYVIDRTDGTELPADYNAFIRSCYLLGVTRCQWANKDIFLSNDMQELISAQLAIAISPSIMTMKLEAAPYQVGHQRYILKQPITDDEALLLKTLRDADAPCKVTAIPGLSRVKMAAYMRRKLVTINLDQLQFVSTFIPALEGSYEKQ